VVVNRWQRKIESRLISIMKVRAKAWLEFSVFCTAFAALMAIHQHFRALDHWMALIWLCFLVVAGIFALIKTYSGKSRYGMPAFLNALPRSWQRWFLGESDDGSR
jgi:hypothetical protein